MIEQLLEIIGQYISDIDDTISGLVEEMSVED